MVQQKQVQFIMQRLERGPNWPTCCGGYSDLNAAVSMAAFTTGTGACVVAGADRLSWIL